MRRRRRRRRIEEHTLTFQVSLGGRGGLVGGAIGGGYRRGAHPYISTCGYVWVKYGCVWVRVNSVLPYMVIAPDGTIRDKDPLVNTTN